MTDPSGDKDRPAADPTAPYDPPPTADPAPYAPENYDPPVAEPAASDTTVSDTVVSDTSTSDTVVSDTGVSDTSAAGTSVSAAPGPGTGGTSAAQDTTAAPEQPGQLPPGAYETPAAYIPGTPYATPGEPQPVYQPQFPQPAYQQPYPPAYGQPYPPQVPYGQPYAAAPRQQDNALAIGALVCSILGFCSLVTALAGLIMGHIALSKTNRGEAGGRGLATAAVIVGYVVIALWTGFFTTLIILGANGYLD